MMFALVPLLILIHLVQSSACPCFSSASNEIKLNVSDDFCRFCSIHEKQYDSLALAVDHFKSFQENMKLVQLLNKQYAPGTIFSAIHSPFGDQSVSKFRDSILMTRPNMYSHYDAEILANVNRQHVASRKLKNEQRPTEYWQRASSVDHVDWVTKGAVTEVKDQGTLGTCWAFSTAGVIEGQLALTGRKLANVSVEHLIECDAARDDKSKDADCAEFGGWPALAFEYLEKFGGVYSEERFPYCAGTIDKKSRLPLCFPCMPKNYDRKSCGDHSDLFCNTSTTLGQTKGGLCSKISKHDSIAKVKSWHKLSSNETILANELENNGPVSVALNANLLQFYWKGVFDPYLCSSKKDALNHAVLLVGFGVDQKSKKPYWKVKNSWGTKFGEDGYFRIKRNAGKCGINTQASTATIY